MEQFAAVVKVDNTDLKDAYESLNAEFEASKDAAKNVSDRIDKVESVADDLFAEWEDELQLYKNQDLRQTSAEKLKYTCKRYRKMLASMRRAEKSMGPVLSTFQDNVLFLKHNLNAQANRLNQYLFPTTTEGAVRPASEESPLMAAWIENIAVIMVILALCFNADYALEKEWPGTWHQFYHTKLKYNTHIDPSSYAVAKRHRTYEFYQLSFLNAKS